MEAFFVYIIFSPSIDAFYIGYTSDLTKRLNQHNSEGFKKANTNRAQDWEIFYKIQCLSESQAKQIEKHIKKNKSRKYLQNIKVYPNISKSLLDKYS